MSEKPIERYEVRLADACEALHMSHTGASDPLPDAERARLVAYLRMRLETWTPSPAFCAVYDGTWQRLVEATLREQERGTGA